MRTRRISGAIVVAAALMGGFASGIEPFRKGEKVVCFGDSITHGGKYIWALQLFENLRHPGLDVRFENRGWGGDSLTDGLLRWDWDVKPLCPDRVIMMFGMNDVGRRLYGANAATSADMELREGRFEAYRTNLVEMCRLIGKDVPRIDIMTPTPFDEYSSKVNAPNNPGCNEFGLARIADITRRFAEEKGMGIVENHLPMTRLLRQNPDSGIGGPDRVHPLWEGHYIVLANILQALGEKPLVASVSVNAKTQAVKSENADVSEVNFRPGKISFTYHPKSLPFPYTPALKKVDSLIRFTERFNQEPLCVSGLPFGSFWRLCADGRPLGVFTAAQFEAGVNMAVLETASAQMARRAAEAMEEIQVLVGDLRTVTTKDLVIRQMKSDPEDYESACKALDRDLVVHKRSAWHKAANKKWKDLKPRVREIEAKCEMLRDAMRARLIPSVLTLETVSDLKQKRID